ncbi:hypothetical protein L611_007000000080 [Aminobacter sp. J15]|nr:hypothetical protein L611_007000000080 [Aminobacter sp. J15]
MILGGGGVCAGAGRSSGLVCCAAHSPRSRRLPTALHRLRIAPLLKRADADPPLRSGGGGAERRRGLVKQRDRWGGEKPLLTFQAGPRRGAARTRDGRLSCRAPRAPSTMLRMALLPRAAGEDPPRRCGCGIQSVGERQVARSYPSAKRLGSGMDRRVRPDDDDVDMALANVDPNGRSGTRHSAPPTSQPFIMPRLDRSIHSGTLTLIRRIGLRANFMRTLLEFPLDYRRAPRAPSTMLRMVPLPRAAGEDPGRVLQGPEPRRRPARTPCNRAAWQRKCRRGCATGFAPPGRSGLVRHTRDRLLAASASAHAASTPFFFAVQVAT